jgi:ankyrin repeat protein
MHTLLVHTQNPEVLCIRNRRDKFKLLLHAAALGGSTSLVSLLDPLPEDILARDSDGVTALHYAAASCKYELVKFLAAKANCNVHVGEGSVTGKVTSSVLRLSLRFSLHSFSSFDVVCYSARVFVGLLADCSHGAGSSMRYCICYQQRTIVHTVLSSSMVIYGIEHYRTA